VENIRRIMAEFDIHHATPQEARQRLGLPHPAPKVAAMAVSTDVWQSAHGRSDG